MIVTLLLDAQKAQPLWTYIEGETEFAARLVVKEVLRQATSLLKYYPGIY